MRQLILLFFLMFSISACGKKGALIYPEMLVPAAPATISLQQSGESLKLSFALPTKDRAGRRLSNLAGVIILKRDAAAGQLPGCSACSEDYYLFKELNPDLLPTTVQRNGSMVSLLDGAVSRGRDYSYLVSAYTGEGIAGARSVAVTAALVQSPLPPVLQVISQPTEINLEIAGLLPQEGVFVGYNVYRTVKGGTASYWPLNKTPLQVNHFSDVGLDRGTSYIYSVRTVVRHSTGLIVESASSNESEGRLKDDE